MRIEDYAESLRGHRVLHLVGEGNKAASMAAHRAGAMDPAVPLKHMLLNGQLLEQLKRAARLGYGSSNFVVPRGNFTRCVLHCAKPLPLL